MENETVKPMIPTVHMNGNSAQSLLEELHDGIVLIKTAQEALASMDVAHGRNWYPQGDGATTKAREEHFARIRKLAEVRKELEAIAEGVYQQKRK